MRRNVAGQFVTAKLINKADGTPCTSGTTTVYVTGDAGTQAAGSVGSGAATHEGNGVWSYAPAQAETNYTQVDFVFVNTNAVNAGPSIYPTSYDANGRYDIGSALGTAVTLDANNVLNVSTKYWAGTAITATSIPVATAAGAAGGLQIAGNNAATTYATLTVTGAFSVNGVNAVSQTGDSFARLGAPAGASVSVDIASVKTDTGTTLPATLVTIASYIDTEVAAIKAKTDQLTFTVANVLDTNLLRIGGSTAHLTAFKQAVQGNVIGTCAAAGSTTVIKTSSMTPAPSVADQLKGRIVTFLEDTATAALRGQTTDITASSASATPDLTVTALTTAPAAGDTFCVT